ncbi:MAG: LamG domain-containing protein [Bacteriovoracaceae bacterium]|nr:LamG domain-containing protein [Bacteriovoracaceae bacterium]
MKLLALLILASCARFSPLPPLSSELAVENSLHISFDPNMSDKKFIDLSGNNHHATQRENYWSLPTATEVAKEASALTFAIWVKTKKSNPDPQDLFALSINAKAPSSTSRASLRLIDRYPVAFGRSFDEEAAQEVKSKIQIPENQWVHIAATINYELNQIQLFINGAPVETQGKVAFKNKKTPASASYNASIGAEDDGSNFHFQGELREAFIWKRALNPIELQQLYNQQKAHF